MKSFSVYHAVFSSINPRGGTKTIEYRFMVVSHATQG
jgi:hypothetical protein